MDVSGVCMWGCSVGGELRPAVGNGEGHYRDGAPCANYKLLCDAGKKMAEKSIFFYTAAALLVG